MSSPRTPPSIGAEQAELLAHGPVPRPTSDTREFWSATARHELHMPFCETCSRYFFYPRSHCRYCQSDRVVWRRVTGKGTLASYVINHLPFPEFETKQPQVIAVIELDEGVNFLSQIIADDPKPEQFTLGMALEVVFIERGEITLPFFIPSAREEVTENA